MNNSSENYKIVIGINMIKMIKGKIFSKGFENCLKTSGISVITYQIHKST